jgi:hypothetical protein
MLTELGDHDLMIALVHARNSTANVGFGAMLVDVGEGAFRNIMRAYYLFEINSAFGICDENVPISTHYDDLRRHLGAVAFLPSTQPSVSFNPPQQAITESCSHWLHIFVESRCGVLKIRARKDSLCLYKMLSCRNETLSQQATNLLHNLQPCRNNFKSCVCTRTA